MLIKDMVYVKTLRHICNKNASTPLIELMRTSTGVVFGGYLFATSGSRAVQSDNF